MRSHYLDAWEENASLEILIELGASIPKENGSPSTQQLSYSADFGREHVSGNAVVITGPVVIDVRDSADCWIRVFLGNGEHLQLPPAMYRRLHEITSFSYEPIYRHHLASDDVGVVASHSYRDLVCELCRQFFEAGWVTGTGGSISIRYGNRIYMTPSGVQKERIKPDDLFVLDKAGTVLAVPQQKFGGPVPKLSDCSPLFLHAFQQRNAGAVLHSHSVFCNLATTLYDGEDSFRIGHQEMIKGIAGYGYFDELVIPIIENTAWEHELADSLGDCIRNNPKACAVLVRRHGMYVWGSTWEQAKRHGEVLHYLFEIAVNLRRLGVRDLCAPPSVNICKKRLREDTNADVAPRFKWLLFDIEGTTTPITFVKDTLFPIAAKNTERYLSLNWNNAADAQTIQELIVLAKLDAVASPSALAAHVRKLIAEDSKASALKDLQGRIWEDAYASGLVASVVYEDVQRLFARAKSSGVFVAIYSSGSRKAQRLLFTYSDRGDLTNYISCYFDTSSGNKREPASYENILLSLGANANEVLFVTDVLEEAQAARTAGLSVSIALRPGNLTLPPNHLFNTIATFDDILL